MPRSWSRGAAVVAALAATVWLGLALGPAGFEPWPSLSPVVVAIRLPRLLQAIGCGAGLAAAGAVLQSLLRNPLADPYIVGVSGGAALGGVVAVLLGLESLWVGTATAFAGAAFGTGGMLLLARGAGKTDPLTLLLLGVIFNAFAAAVVTLCKISVSATKAQEILFWLVGAIGVRPWSELTVVLAAIGSGVLILWRLGGALNLLALGDDDAAALGLHPERTRTAAFLAASLAVAAAVATAGLIGFVGLIVPHVVRRLLGADMRVVIPASAVGGGALLLFADILARNAFVLVGTELPVGVITACAGGPFFLAILLRRR